MLKTYTIDQGKHGCNGVSWPVKINATEMLGSFRLHRNCWYPPNQADWHINKLWGWGTDIWNANSNRIGWRPDLEQHKFQLYAYMHLDGKWVRSSKLRFDSLGVCSADELVYWNIKINEAQDWRNNEVAYTCGITTVERHYPVDVSWGWRQHFYFGGKPTAPWTMTADIEYAV